MIDHDYHAHSGEDDKELWRSLRGPIGEDPLSSVQPMKEITLMEEVKDAVLRQLDETWWEGVADGLPRFSDLVVNASVSAGWVDKSAAEILADVNELLNKTWLDDAPLPPGCRWDFGTLVIRKDSPLYPAAYRWWMDSIKAKMKWYRSKRGRLSKRPDRWRMK